MPTRSTASAPGPPSGCSSVPYAPIMSRGGRTEQLAAPHPAGRRDRRLGVLGAADRGQHLLLQRVTRTRGRSPPSVAEQRDRLRGAQQQIGGEPAGGQHTREVLGGGALVAQQPQIPGRRAERVGDLAEAEQPGVRVGGVGEPAQQHGQQRALDGGLAAHARGQGLQVAQRRGRVGVARAPPAAAARPRREPGLAGRRAGRRRPAAAGRRASRAAGARRAACRVHALCSSATGSRAQAQRTAQPAQVGLVLGHQMRAAQPVELDAVLHRAQEAVRGVQLRRRPARPTYPPAASACSASRVVPLRSVASVRPCTSWSSCTANSTSRSPPGPSFSSRSTCGGGDVLDDAAAHLLHVGDEVLPLGGLPDQRGDGVDCTPRRARRPRPPAGP